MKRSIIAIGLACLWLTACSPPRQLEQDFTTYLARLATVLQVEPPVLGEPAKLPPLPPQRALQLEQPRVTAGLLDTLRLGECRLLALVGEHNGPVGKSGGAAADLIYHLRFQQGLNTCLANTDDTALRDWLYRLQRQKAPLLSGYHWNMMVAEPEIRQALTPRRRPLGRDLQPGFQTTYEAFNLFARLHPQSAHPAQADSRQLHRHLGGLYDNDYLGRLFYSLHSAAHYLSLSLAFLERLETLDCGPRVRPDAERLRNAMQHYYIGRIQPRLSELDRRFVQLAPLLQQSLLPPPERTAVMADYLSWYASGLDSQIYVRYRQLTLEHARRWQRFLARCDISPT